MHATIHHLRPAAMAGFSELPCETSLERTAGAGHQKHAPDSDAPRLMPPAAEVSSASVQSLSPALALVPGDTFSNSDVDGEESAGCAAISSSRTGCLKPPGPLSAPDQAGTGQLPGALHRHDFGGAEHRGLERSLADRLLALLQADDQPT